MSGDRVGEWFKDVGDLFRFQLVFDVVCFIFRNRVQIGCLRKMQK